MKCLGCGAEMTEETTQTRRGLVSYDVCEVCGGIWFDAGEMDAVVLQLYQSVEESSRDRAEGVSEKQRRCPRCGDQWMDKVFFLAHSDILLDHCERCGGFWLDGGELELINQNLRQLESRRSPAEKVLERIMAFLEAIGPPGS